MPAISFPEYARGIQDILDFAVAATDATLVRIEIDARSSQHGLVAGLVRFNDASELHFREFVNTNLAEPRLMYAYHYQDANTALIFRYDNAAHRPLLPQPEHRHTSSGIQVSPAPTLAKVLDEILLRSRS